MSELSRWALKTQCPYCEGELKLLGSDSDRSGNLYLYYRCRSCDNKTDYEINDSDNDTVFSVNVENYAGVDLFPALTLEEVEL